MPWPSGVRRFNWVFDTMWLIYADRTDPSLGDAGEMAGPSIGGRSGRGCGRGRGQKRKTAELEAVKRKRMCMNEAADV